MRLRRLGLEAVRRRGLEPQLRRVQEVIGPMERRRDLRDIRQIELLLAYTLTEHANCVDIGANRGDVLRRLVHLAPRGRHVAFEPLPELARDLRVRFPGVDVHACALHDVSGERPFHRVRDCDWRSSLLPMGLPPERLETFPVPVRRLDDVLPVGYAPSLIKIDVEGAEGGVLQGALDTLRRHRPLVVLEHGRHARHFPVSTERIFALLTDDAGLRVFDIDGGGPYDSGGFSDCVRRGALWTFVARP